MKKPTPLFLMGRVPSVGMDILSARQFSEDGALVHRAPEHGQFVADRLMRFKVQKPLPFSCQLIDS